MRRWVAFLGLKEKLESLKRGGDPVRFQVLPGEEAECVEITRR
jgi:hypothetical protein